MLCTPAFVYLVILILGTLMSIRSGINWGSFLFGIIWVFVINIVCNRVSSMLAWALILVPVVASFIIAAVTAAK